MINFLETNYIWLIVAGVIILMAIIGYFAEKSEGHKKTKQKVNKMEKEEIDVPVVNEIAETTVDPFNDDLKEDVQSNENESLNVEPEIEDESEFGSFDENLYSDIDEETELQVEPIQGEEVPVQSNEEILEQNNDYGDELASKKTSELDYSEEPVSQPSESIEQNSYANEEIDKDVDELGVNLPSLETLDEEIKDVDDEDDVWKF